MVREVYNHTDYVAEISPSFPVDTTQMANMSLVTVRQAQNDATKTQRHMRLLQWFVFFYTPILQHSSIVTSICEGKIHSPSPPTCRTHDASPQPTTYPSALPILDRHQRCERRWWLCLDSYKGCERYGREKIHGSGLVFISIQFWSTLSV